MKKIYLFCALFVAFSSLAQIHSKPTNTDDIAEAEAKSASKTLLFQANPNTLNYDVIHHKLEFTVDPAVYFVTGKITTTFTALSTMTTVTFDMANELTVSTVTKNGSSLAFLQNGNNELVITLPTTLATGNTAIVEINYSGAPPVNGFEAFSTNVHGGAPILYTLSEPFGARDWWPCKQDLNDKVSSIDVYITAPSQYVSVSNGVEPAAPVISGANKTTHFHHGYPIPAYLIAIAVTNYSIINQTGGTAPNQYPIINYLYPETLISVQPLLNQTPLILNLFESLFEIYPFHNEKYGHAQFGWGGGMEHTTVSFMVNFDRQLIAHEMAHQWFGDKITCGTWQDIWLNESFATYLASLVIENFDGDAAFTQDKSSMINSITNFAGGSVYIAEADATNVNRIFSSRLSYKKGAMVLNMLRLKMGNVAFFQTLKNYLADVNLAYGYALTPNFQAHAEAVYGSSLTEFFNDWIYNQGYPTYTITAQNIGGGKARFVVNQTQSHSSVSFFEMPVPIRVFGANNQQADLILNNISNGQTFEVNVPFVVTSVSFDPKKELISKNSSITLGLQDFELQAISLYPNPATNKLSLDLPIGVTIQKATFFNLLGQKTGGSTLVSNWDVSGFAKGVYFLNIDTNFGSKTLKFIKE